MKKKKSRLLLFPILLIFTYTVYGQTAGNSNTVVEINHDLSCLDDEEDLGSTDIIGIFKEINDEFVDAIAAEISREEELDFADQAHTEIKSNVTFIEDSRLDNLRSILRKLVHEIPDPVGYDYTVYLIDDETINAYTTGSGFIYFYSGVLT